LLLILSYLLYYYIIVINQCKLKYYVIFQYSLIHLHIWDCVAIYLYTLSWFNLFWRMSEIVYVYWLFWFVENVTYVYTYNNRFFDRFNCFCIL